MPKKPETEGDDASSNPFSESVRESAQQIWLAGLGAFSKAQAEGGKVFDALVKEGVAMQQRTQAAGDKFAEATSRMAAKASELAGKPVGWDKLQSMFEDRLARGLQQLGVPTARDLAALSQRVTELEEIVAELRREEAARKDQD